MKPKKFQKFLKEIILKTFSLEEISPAFAFAGGMPNSDNGSTNSANSAETQNQQNTSEITTSNEETSNNTDNSNTQTSQNTSNTNSDDSQTSSNGFLAIEDEPLIIDESGISDSDGVGKIYVQWQKETPDKLKNKTNPAISVDVTIGLKSKYRS